MRLQAELHAARCRHALLEAVACEFGVRVYGRFIKPLFDIEALEQLARDARVFRTYHIGRAQLIKRKSSISNFFAVYICPLYALVTAQHSKQMF